jgi:hypothetical protein
VDSNYPSQRHGQLPLWGNSGVQSTSRFDTWIAVAVLWVMGMCFDSNLDEFKMMWKVDKVEDEASESS